MVPWPFYHGTSWRNWAKSWLKNDDLMATWLCTTRIHHKNKIPAQNEWLEAITGGINWSDHKSTSSTRTWTHQTHRTQICHITVTHLRLISDACVSKRNACVHYLNACVQCLYACVTYFWGAWVFALILEVPDLLKVEKRGYTIHSVHKHPVASGNGHVHKSL